MVQLSKRIKIEEQGDDGANLIYTGKDNTKVVFAFQPGAAGLFVNGENIVDSIVGVDPIPVVRTNNPIVGSSDVNENIDALDAAIGVDITPCAPRVSGACLVANSVNANIDALDLAIGDDVTSVARTNNPIVSTHDILANLSHLDACIGTDGDISVVTRTKGQVVSNSTVNAKFDMVDEAIGADADMTSTRALSVSNSVYQNLNALDIKKSVRTIKKSITLFGGGGDYTWGAGTNDSTARNLQLTNIVPAACKVIDVQLVCTATLTGTGNHAFTIGAGNASAGAQYIVAASCHVLNDVVGSSDALLAPLVSMIWNAASSVWIIGDPDANWDTYSAGSWAVYVTIIDFSGI